MCLKLSEVHSGCGCPRRDRSLLYCESARRSLAACTPPTRLNEDVHTRVCVVCTVQLRRASELLSRMTGHLVHFTQEEEVAVESDSDSDTVRG